MLKNSLQQKIIFIFFIFVAIILIGLNIFSYFMIKQVYFNGLSIEIMNSMKSFSDELTKDYAENSLNFKKRFSINDNERKGYFVKISEIDKLPKEIKFRIEELNNLKLNNKIIENEEVYEYFDIKVNDLNEKYIVYVIQSKNFINMQLDQYLLTAGVSMAGLLGITCVIGAILSRNIISPIKKLSKNLDEIIQGKKENIVEIETYGSKNEIYVLVEKFKILANKLSENLNEMSNQKAQLETILLHMSDGILAFDIYGNLIYKNPAAMNMLDLSKKYDKFDDIFKKLCVDVNLEKVIYLQDWTSSEKRACVNDSYVNLYFEPFKDTNDVIGGVIVLIQDITEQVKLDNMRKEFVANVSHELKTPITSIKGYSEALHDNKLDGETSNKFLKVIVTEAERMSRLVSDLLQLSRFDISKTQNKKIEFDLGDLTKKVLEKLNFEIDKRGHEVECYVTADVPKIHGDKDGMEQVILNVIGNSIKYTPDYGKIKIYVGFVYNHAYIKVIDNGIGIPGKELKRIFERFYRVDKARSREQGGTGLGLAIAKEIVERNGGSIDVVSEVNKGSEFIIRLPVK